jgi:hypothetical protein
MLHEPRGKKNQLFVSWTAQPHELRIYRPSHANSTRHCGRLRTCVHPHRSRVVALQFEAMSMSKAHERHMPENLPMERWRMIDPLPI